MVRQAHHLTTLSQVEGQITMIEIQNPKQFAFDLINLNIFLTAEIRISPKFSIRI
jgi:hypothetical protein